MKAKDKEFVLWGRHASYSDGAWIKVSGGTLRQCRGDWKRLAKEGGWKLVILVKGSHPDD